MYASLEREFMRVYRCVHVGVHGPLFMRHGPKLSLRLTTQLKESTTARLELAAGLTPPRIQRKKRKIKIHHSTANF